MFEVIFRFRDGWRGQARVRLTPHEAGILLLYLLQLRGGQRKGWFTPRRGDVEVQVWPDGTVRARRPIDGLMLTSEPLGIDQMVVLRTLAIPYDGSWSAVIQADDFESRFGTHY
jgi:hypothetical protein